MSTEPKTRSQTIAALWKDPEWRARTIAARNAAGRQWSDTARQKASRSHTGKKHTPERRQKISDTLAGKVTTEQVERARSMGRANKGRRPSLLTRYKQSAAHTGHPSPKKGHTLSEATKRLIGDKVAANYRATSILGLRAKRRHR